jgi:hypothetical protein
MGDSAGMHRRVVEKHRIVADKKILLSVVN